MQKLTKAVKLAYGVGDLGGNLFFTVMGFYLLYYLTNVVGLAAGLAGTALMIGKAWDAVTDPAVGYVSDRTRSRWGRRRPYMFVGAILLAFSMVAMFTAPPAGQMGLFLYVTLMYCVLNTAYTLVNIPYGAMTPELTDDFHERTVLNGYRMSFAVVGTFIGAGAVLPIVSGLGGGPHGWMIMGAVMGVIMAATTLIVVLGVKEGARAKATGPQRNIIASYIDVLGMKTFLTALIPWSLHITGVNIIQASLLYYFRYIYGNEAGFQIALPILLASAILCIPLWVRISRHIGKKKSYNTGMLIFAGSVLLFFLFGHQFGMWFSFVIMAVGGVGFATQYVMPYSILPDVVEYDYSETGVRREGVFYGMWTFISKLGQALGIAASGWILTAFGYRETVAGAASAVQPDSALTGIRLLVGPVPAFLFVCGVIVLHFYPITRERYEQIMTRIKLREVAAVPPQPEVENT